MASRAQQIEETRLFGKNRSDVIAAGFTGFAGTQREPSNNAETLCKKIRAVNSNDINDDRLRVMFQELEQL